MVCNNALVLESKEGRYSIELPDDKKAEMNEVCKQALKNHHGYVHVEIAKVRHPRSLKQNALFHSVLGQYFTSGLHSYATIEELKAHLKFTYGTVIQVNIEGYVVLKHTADYNTDEFGPLINGTIKEALLHKVDSKKFREILDEIGFTV